MGLFLSYAEEDGEAALKIATRLAHSFEVYDWQRERGGRFLERIEREINEAEAYIALLSPHFIASPYCRLEREFAIHRELQLQAADPSLFFIHVLQIAEMPYPSAGLLQNFDWIDLTNTEKWERGMEQLAGKLASSGSAAAALNVPSQGQSSPMFRNREQELEEVQRGLTNPGGPHFWLVIAPIGLGKSRFLQQLGTRMGDPEQQSVTTAGSAPWVVKLLDLSDQPLDARSDARLLLASFFGRTSPVSTEPEELREIAREINRGRRPYLCLLDSAELLERKAAKTLRLCLSQIYDFVQDARNIDVRLAFVVASRREAEWRGVPPAPVKRLVERPLSEFTVGVLRQALDDLATQMHRDLKASELEENAERMRSLSEGLPALLAECLDWIERKEWMEMNRLESQEVFEELAMPYIDRVLLSVDKLLHRGGRNLGEERQALVEAFRILAPYRLFTRSHLSWHVESHDPLAEALAGLGWTTKDLWAAIGETDLLSRPQRELWRETYPPIRRLLYRSYLTDDEARAAAHREARKFVEVWADKQTGKEQIVGLVECLWHEAAMLVLERPTELERELLESARKFSRALRPSPAYTVEELRESAVERIENDSELQGTVGPELLHILAAIVMSPGDVA